MLPSQQYGYSPFCHLATLLSTARERETNWLHLLQNETAHNAVHGEPYTKHLLLHLETILVAMATSGKPGTHVLQAAYTWYLQGWFLQLLFPGIPNHLNLAIRRERHVWRQCYSKEHVARQATWDFSLMPGYHTVGQGASGILEVCGIEASWNRWSCPTLHPLMHGMVA